MSADTQTAPPAKKGKGLIVKLVLVLLLLAAGGGVAFGLQVAGIIGGGGEGHAEEEGPDVPRLLRKGEDDPYAVKTEGEAEEAVAEVAGEGGSKYRTAYFVFNDDFTSNLRDSSALIQTRIAVSTHYDGRVLMWLKKHELAVRSRIFIELADTPEADVLTPDGKERLQKRLAGAINEVLTAAEGFGGVDAVYFQSLMVQ